MSGAIDKSICTVKELLLLSNLSIPSYQRPYKWTLKNVSDLFRDLYTHQDKSAYRLGSVVFHQENKSDDKAPLNIVDGQQRTLTLMLAVWALIENRREELVRSDLCIALDKLKPAVDAFMVRQQFASDISQYNLYQNYLEAKRLVSRPEFTEAHIDFLLHKCQVVVFVLLDVSEAFQFFDSQNARGRDLEPHDLLKAFHLREFAGHENDLKAVSVAHWESLDSDKLADLFATYLYRVRQWAQGKPARYFGKNEVGLFKGVNIDKVGYFPYVESLRIAHHFVDDYNSQYQRKVDGQKMGFPFHLDQMIINGRRFFEMAEHYQLRVEDIVTSEYQSQGFGQAVVINGVMLDDRARKIINTLNSYGARTRTGDRYIRSMFDCALIFYIDKFGQHNLSNAIEKLFIWAYSCRIKQQVVQLATMDNYVLGHNVFMVIKDATQPSDVLAISLATIKDAENKNNSRDSNASTDELVLLFKEMNYYE